MSQEMQEGSRSQKRQGNVFPPEPPGEMQSCCHLDFSLVKRLWASDLQDRERVSLYCSKPLGL